MHFQTNPSGGWVGSVLTKNNTTSWLHLASWNLLDSQLSWVSKMGPSVAISVEGNRNWCKNIHPCQQVLQVVLCCIGWASAPAPYGSYPSVMISDECFCHNLNSKYANVEILFKKLQFNNFEWIELFLKHIQRFSAYLSPTIKASQK